MDTCIQGRRDEARPVTAVGHGHSSLSPNALGGKAFSCHAIWFHSGLVHRVVRLGRSYIPHVTLAVCMAAGRDGPRCLTLPRNTVSGLFSESFSCVER